MAPLECHFLWVTVFLFAEDTKTQTVDEQLSTQTKASVFGR